MSSTSATRTPMPSPKPRPREIQHVIDQGRHPFHADSDARRNAFERGVRDFFLEQYAGGIDRLQRIAQIVAENGNELFAQFVVGMRAAQRRLILLPRHFAVELHRDERSEAREHAEDFRISHLGRRRINGAEISKVAAVWQNDRHRYIAFDLVKLRRVVIAVTGIGARMFDDDGCIGPP